MIKIVCMHYELIDRNITRKLDGSMESAVYVYTVLVVNQNCESRIQNALVVRFFGPVWVV